VRGPRPATDELTEATPWTLERKLALGYVGVLTLWLLALLALQADDRLGPVALECSRAPLIALGVAVVALAITRLADARLRIAWALIGLGYLCVLIGDAIGGWRMLHGLPPSLVSNGLWLAYFPFVLAGVLCLPRVFHGGLDRGRFFLDALIVTIGGGLMIWVLAVRPTLGVDGDEAVNPYLALAYPVGDLISAFSMVLALARVPGSLVRRAHGLLALSFFASFAGDLVWSATFAIGATQSKLVPQILWSVWAAAFLAAALALVTASARKSAARVRSDDWNARGALPYLSLAGAFAISVWLAYLDDRIAVRGAVIATGVMAALAILRMALTQIAHARLLTESLRRRGEAKLAALVEHSADAILVLEPNQGVSYASPAAVRLLGDGDQAPSGLSFGRYLHPDDAPGLQQYLDACVRRECQRATLMLRVASTGGGWRTLETQLGNLLDNPAVAGIVLNLHDVSEHQALEAQLRFQAFHDELTQLPNRELFLDRLERALSRARAGGGRVAVALIDLDRFQRLNDRLGHRLADQALAHVAERLAGAVEHADSLARFGADDFAVLMEQAGDSAELVARAERIRAAIATPFALTGQRVVLSASVGIATSAEGGGAETVLRNADVALQQARAGGGDSIELFDPARHQGTLDHLRLEDALPGLVERGAFAVQFQPVLRLPERRLSGLAVRLAWRDPKQALAPMAAIITAAADSGRISMLGEVLRKGLATDLRALVRYQPELARLEILLRLHAHELRDPEIAQGLADMMRAADLRPGQLVVRVGAADFPRLRGAAERALAPLASAGLRLAVADLGAPGSGLDLLTSARVQALFLARGVVRKLGSGAREEALVRAAVAGGRALDLDIYAPGVMGDSQLTALAQYGVRHAYGECVSVPLGFQQLLPWLGARVAEESGPQLPVSASA